MGPIAMPLTIASVCYIALCYMAFAAPFSSSVYSEYIYNYEANLASGPTGFRFKAKAHLELLYTTNDGGQLVKLRLTEPVFFPGQGQTPLVIDRKHGHIYNPSHELYAHIVTLANGTAYIKELYTHEEDVVTFKNIKKSILLNLLPTTHHLKPIANGRQSNNNNVQQQETTTFTHDNNDAQPELFSPDSISQVTIIAKVRKSPNGGAIDHTTTTTTTTTAANTINADSATAGGFLLPTTFQTVEGYQNVTFASRVYGDANSTLTTSFQLELVDQLKSKAHEQFDEAKSIEGAISMLDRASYHPDRVELQRERRICSTHHCKFGLMQLFETYTRDLASDNLASTEGAVAFLRMMGKIREADDASIKSLLDVIRKKKYQASGVTSTVLDIMAAARTKTSIQAALKFLKLASSSDLNTAERFLSVLSVAAKTTAKMHRRRPLQSAYYYTPIANLKLSQAARKQLAPLASLEFIAKEFLHILEERPADRWQEHKLRWSTLLTLATVVSAYNQEHYYETNGNELNQRSSQLLMKELRSCHEEDVDCRIVCLQAIGNVGQFGDTQFEALREQILYSGKRESIAAMKVLRDLLQIQAKDKPFSQDFYNKLKDLTFRVAYDGTHETTARVLAAELIVRFLPNSFAATKELLHNLPCLGNNELATMIYSRVRSLRPHDESLPKRHVNWHWITSIINGTSTSFVRCMAETGSMNASYGVNVELLDKRKLLKESSFDVFLDTKQRTQDLFSLGIFARGLTGGYFGGSDDSDDSADPPESTTAGMTLRLLGGYLRPYVFFESQAELVKHVFKGTGSDPITVFNGDLLLIDHDEGYPLISGFVAEQQMRGVLSIDVTGTISISVMWSKEAHALVRTKAAVIVQAAQTVATSYDNLFKSHLFSFGGSAMIDFMTDVEFSSTPVDLCLQVTQPAFKVRYNSRRHHQLMEPEVTRKLRRRNHWIDGKSYPLNSENNKMCLAMFS